MYKNQIIKPADANQWTRAYFDSILIEARYIDSTVPDTSVEIFGSRFDTPIMTAAFSHLEGIHAGGMIEMSRGAALCNALNFAGMGEDEELEGILATGAKTVKIVKPYADREMVTNKLVHAYKSGAIAVGMDIDHSFDRKGRHDNVRGMEMAPVSSDELKKFVAATPLPFVVKGVLSVSDAIKCRDCGVKAIIVSHHHGIMPYAVPPLVVLPKIVEAVGKDTDIFVDCSVDRGADAFKAIALGAKAVCVGRAVFDDFKIGGAEGVSGYINGMTDELRAIMAKTSCKTLSEIKADLLWNMQ